MSGETRPLPKWFAPLPPNEDERLAELHDYEILDTPPEPVFDDLTWLASHICRTPVAAVTLIDAGRQWFKARIGVERTHLPREESICAHALLNHNDIFEVPDATKDERFASHPMVSGGPGLRFYATAPLVSTSGHAIGTLCVVDHVPRTLTDDERHALRIIAAQAVSELELRRRLHVEQDRLAQLLSVVDAVPCAFVIRDAAGRIAMKNAAANKYVADDDPQATTLTLMNAKGEVLPPDRWPGRRSLSGEQLVEQLIVRQADGVETPVICTAAPVKDRRGRVIAAAVAYQDVTPLAEVARLKNDFVSMVSHELRTPLTAIKGSLQLLEAEATLEPEQTELLTVALSNADRLIRMVNDLLDSAKIEAGKLKLQRRSITVGDLAEMALANVRPIAASARVRLEIDIEPGMRLIHVDVDRMVQAIVNLLSNAIKFAPRGSAVTVGGRRLPDGGVSMTVHDCGEGISPERMPRLFQKFSQLEAGTVGQQKGTGLGLSITKALVEEHGGTIHVFSSPETGTTFEIRLGGDGVVFSQMSATSP